MGILDFLTKNASGLLVLGQFFLFFFTAALAKNFPTRGEHKTLSRIVDAHEVYIAQNKLEVQQLRADINDAPTQEAIHDLSLQITEFKGDLKVFSEKFKSFGDVSDRLQIQVDRIDGFLMAIKTRS